MKGSSFFRIVSGIWQRHRWVRVTLKWGGAAALICLLLLLAVAGWVMSRHVPQEAIDAMVPGCEIFDCDGNLLEVRRGSDWRWCLPIPLSEVPAELVEDVIAVEDRRFREHRGVDFAAMGRAVLQLADAGRIVSGASTITMQVVNQYCGRGRGITYKLRQIGMAYNWEKTHSKEQILEDYFNLLPYGGKLHGIEAASRYYFGRSARDLNRSEQLLLVGLPQSPNRFRPDRHPERALWRRDVVLIMLQRAGRISAEEAQRIQEMPLRYRDFSLPCWQRAADRDFIELAVRKYPGRRRLHLSLSREQQSLLRRTLEQWHPALPGVADGAGVIIENATGKVRALVGTLKDGDPAAAQVNAATAKRSPGSTFKPFIYGEAINGGIIASETMLLDAPLHLNDYRPGNFNDDFRGTVTAAVALADSLNTPAVRLLRELSPARMLKVLSDCGVLHLSEAEIPAAAQRCGLSLAIGGLESTLLDLTAAYSALGSRGQALLLEDEVSPQPHPCWLPGTRAMLLQMMRLRALPGAGPVDAAWKTGTSNGNRDAWCFAVTPEWTVGIWFGNKNGRPADVLVGGTAAAPVAGQIIASLHDGMPIHWPENDILMKNQELCSATGLKAGAYCPNSFRGATVAGIPLRICQMCQNLAIVDLQENTDTPTDAARILSPAPGTYRASHDGKVSFVLQLEPSPCHLYLNGRHLGEYSSGDRLSLESGTWLLLAWNAARPNAHTISLTVENGN